MRFQIPRQSDIYNAKFTFGVTGSLVLVWVRDVATSVSMIDVVTIVEESHLSISSELKIIFACECHLVIWLAIEMTLVTYHVFVQFHHWCWLLEMDIKAGSGPDNVIHVARHMAKLESWNKMFYLCICQTKVPWWFHYITFFPHPTPTNTHTTHTHPTFTYCTYYFLLRCLIFRIHLACDN